MERVMTPTEIDVIKRIFTVNLSARKDENVLVFTDLIRKDEAISAEERKKRVELREIALKTAEVGRGFCNVTYAEFPGTMGHGYEPPEEAWSAAVGEKAVNELKGAGLFENLLTKKTHIEDIREAEVILSDHARPVNAVVALSNHSTSHTRFRDLMTRCLGARYASMPLFERAMLTGAMSADWVEIEARTLRAIERLKGADMVYVTSHNGTSISFSIKGRAVMPDTGILRERGSFSNLPAGEAFVAPVEGTANGTLIIEYAPTRKLSAPISLEVRDGLIAGVDGRDPFAETLRKNLSINRLVGNIAELGIGTNDKAKRPDNILETEKILGTVHIALGDNSSFGGRVRIPFHEDFIFFRPTVEATRGEEKVEVLIDGEPRF
jgi:leucyl aminopeptidase (aminopeptidase T)